MKWKSLIVAALLFCVASEADARVRLFRPRGGGGCAGGSCSVSAVSASTECKDGVCTSVSGVAIVREGHWYELARARAQAQADRMACGHWLGAPSGCFEGAGMALSEEAAIRNCCYWGQRKVRAVATVQRGIWWFACTLYE